MAMGIGKRYFVHIIKCHFGDLDQVINFMKDNAPKSKFQWFEVRPIVHIDNSKEKSIWLTEYEVTLVEKA